MPLSFDEVTADFLVQTGVSERNDNKAFKDAMKKAILEAISQIRTKLGKETITVEDVRKWFNLIAEERKKLAVKQNALGKEDFVESTLRQDKRITHDIVINRRSHAHYYVFRGYAIFIKRNILRKTILMIDG